VDEQKPRQLSVEFSRDQSQSLSVFADDACSTLALPSFGSAKEPDSQYLHPSFLHEYFRPDKKTGKGIFSDDAESGGGSMVAQARFSKVSEKVCKPKDFCGPAYYPKHCGFACPARDGPRLVSMIQRAEAAISTLIATAQRAAKVPS
jgi:hypothetical protein